MYQQEVTTQSPSVDSPYCFASSATLSSRLLALCSLDAVRSIAASVSSRSSWCRSSSEPIWMERWFCRPIELERRLRRSSWSKPG